jgi:toxin-antitoxin system PIN domain toxin
MQLPDVNVLIYAHREDASEHPHYTAWLRALTASAAPFALSEVVLAGFLRVVTNRRIFDPPTPMETAIAFCQGLVTRPRAVIVAPGRQHWDIFVGLCRRIQGPLVTDAYLAALAIEHGCELITTDSDFARFPGLRWGHPLRPRTQVH